jgi:hypothetical protein
MYKTDLNSKPKPKNFSNLGEYSLKQNFFDPTKNSPPNEFMIKLYMRSQIHNTCNYINNTNNYINNLNNLNNYKNELKCDVK